MKHPQSVADEAKSTLTPKLRFPEFRDGQGWESMKVDELVEAIVPPKKLQTSAYSANGAFPIIDQSQDAICGWTDDRDALVEDDLPLIIFGDHTCVLKLVEHPFAQGADGIKILNARPTISTRFLFQSLSFRPVTTEEYKRHFSILKERVVFFPDVRTGEQQKIAECLSTLDELIGAEGQKRDALKAHKKGLMQQLFPREGETLPRLRFPEFRNAPEWGAVPLGELLSRSPEYGVNAPAAPYSDGLPTYLRITDIDEDGQFLSKAKASVDIVPTDENYLSDGDIVLARTGASVGKSYRYRPKDGPLVFAGFLIRIRPNPDKIDSVFLANFFTTTQYWDWVKITSPRSGQPGLNGPEYASLLIPLPSSGPLGLAEQQRIASCLSSLDDLIAAQSTRIEALKTHKQGLMQQLFPSPEEAALS